MTTIRGRRLRLPLFISGLFLALPSTFSYASSDTVKTAPHENVETLIVTSKTKKKTSIPLPSGIAPTYVEGGLYQGRDMLDVPASVSVVPHVIIEQQQGTGLNDALRNVAGVVRQQQSGIAYDQLSVRGINLDNRASYMFNGVLPFDNNLPIPMEDK